MSPEALRAQLSTMDELLREHERITQVQAGRLEDIVTELDDKARTLEATIQAMADGVIVCNEQGRFTHFNAAAEQILGVSAADAQPDKWSDDYGVFSFDTVTPVTPDDLPLARALSGESVEGLELFIRNSIRPKGIWLQTSARPILSDDGTLRGAVSVFHDISERKRFEQELAEQLTREKEKNEMLEQLRASVMELSTPILELWDDILALPIVGVVDSQRSTEIMSRLLEAVGDRQCRFVILDVTGVEVIDSATADRIIKLVSSVELLGARCVLTGIRPQVAQTLVMLGVDLGQLATRRNLKHGLRECLRWMAQDKATKVLSPVRPAEHD